MSVTSAWRLEMEELQRLVSEARHEAETLRADYEEACSSVKQLETLVSESQDQGVESREKWIAETGELRAAVEKLSSDMEQASYELNQLRDANEDLNRRLTEVQQERDQVRLEMDARPDQEEFDSLREQLQSANELMANMQFEHEQTLVRLEAAEQKNRYQTDPEDDPIDAADDEYATEQTVDETVSHEYQSTDNDPDERMEVANESAEEEEDTIEAYMNRLLKHVRGNDGQELDDVTDPQAVDSGQTDASDDEMLEPLDPNAPLVPRSLTPERDSDLDAMRELANTSARIAIKRSARLQSRNTQLKGLIRLSYALGAISCGAVCYLYLTGMVVYVAVMMTGIVSVIYVREAMQFFQEASYQYNAATNALHDENSSVEDDSEYADE